MDPDKIYHMPDLPPPHNYFALYHWLRDEWKADAICHMGKHGTLEWLPGKGVGLSGECYPDTFLDDMPLVYPFIINDPGEVSTPESFSLCGLFLFFDSTLLYFSCSIL